MIDKLVDPKDPKIEVKLQPTMELEIRLLEHGWRCRWAHGVPTDKFSCWTKNGKDILLHTIHGETEKIFYAGDTPTEVEEANLFAEG